MANIKLDSKSTANEIAQAYELYILELDRLCKEYNITPNHKSHYTHSILLNAIEQNNTKLAMQIIRGLAYSCPFGVFTNVNVKIDMTGRVIIYHKNGNVAHKFKILNDMLNGKYKRYNANGVLIYNELYSDGALINKAK